MNTTLTSGTFKVGLPPVFDIKADSDRSDIRYSVEVNIAKGQCTVVLQAVEVSGKLSIRSELNIDNTNTVSVSDELSDSKNEYEAFISMREELKQKYPGQYVAVHGRKVVDHDVDESALIDRFYEKYGNVSVCIDKVEEDETILEVLSPFEVIE